MSNLHPTKTLSALVPRYVTRFACVGAACEDNCCSGWLVTLDKKTFNAYRNSTHPELKPIFIKHIKRSRATNSDLHYGKITTEPGNQTCPAMCEGLCAVQKHMGESHLSNTCFTYPRQTRRFRGQHEQAMNLSCPEAARLALLRADAFDFAEEKVTVREADMVEEFAAFGLTTAAMNDVRIFCLQLMRTTDLALWQRLAILGVFCERLNGTLANGQHTAVPALLDDFAALIEQGAIVDALRDLRPNHEAQAMVFSTLLADKGFSATSKMQAEQVRMIGANLGADSSGQTTAEALVTSYTRGLERLGQALEQTPHLLENYVLNEMFLNLFPFYGINPFDAYLQLVARFGLLRLILAAQCNTDGDLPDANALVNAVHVYCRRFQHQGTFARRVNGALHASGWASLDKLYGFLRS
jgi:lysine-N-methylase